MKLELHHGFSLLKDIIHIFAPIYTQEHEPIEKLKESYILKNPMSIYQIKEEKLSNDIDRLNTFIKVVLDKKTIKSDHIVDKLEVVNPMNTLKIGYSVTKKDNKVISSIKDIKVNDEIRVDIKDGYLISNIKEVKEN